MLKSIDPLLNADLLHVLRAMGHGDDLCIADANFPSDTISRHTTTGTMIRFDGHSTAPVVKAILSVLPLDTFVPDPVRRMEVVGEPDTVLPVHHEVQAAVNAAEGRDIPLGSIERFAFYEAAKQAYAVVTTGEGRPYGCFLFKKGVILSPS